MLVLPFLLITLCGRVCVVRSAGLRAESNDCSHCAWVHGKPDCCECRVVGTGGGANDNVSLAAFDIKLNTGQFAGPP